MIFMSPCSLRSIRLSTESIRFLISSTVTTSLVHYEGVVLFAGSCMWRAPVFWMDEESLVSFCWLSVSLSAMLLEAPRGCEPEVSLSTTLPALRGVWLKSKLNHFYPAAVLLTFNKPKVNIEDVFGGSGRFPEVGEEDAPVIVLEVCVEVSPLNEETWLDASWLTGLFLLTGECCIMFATTRALLVLRVVRKSRLWY